MIYKYFVLHDRTYRMCYTLSRRAKLRDIVNHSCKSIDPSKLKQMDHACIVNASQHTNITFINAACFAEVCTSEDLSTIGSISVILVTLLVFLLGTCGNSLVCVYFGKKARRAKTDIFLISLCLTDLAACVAGPLETVVSLTCPYTKWELDQTGTYTVLYIISATMAISSWTLAAISVDRCWAITRPFQTRSISDKKRVGLCLLIWLLALIASYTFQFNEDFGIDGFAYDIYTGILVCVAWLIPLLAVVVMYAICINRLRRNDLRHSQNETMKKRNADNQRVIQMFVYITILFFATAVPAIAIGLLYPSSDESDKAKLGRRMSNLSLFLGSSLNPLIYAKMHREMRAFMIHIAASILPRTSRRQLYSFTVELSALPGQ